MRRPLDARLSHLRPLGRGAHGRTAPPAPGRGGWAGGPADDQLLPFLADVTRWLAGGRDVLFAEFGLPTYRRGDPVGEAVRLRSASSLVEEQAAAAFTERALTALQRAGSVGAMLWCYTDYAPAI